MKVVHVWLSQFVKFLNGLSRIVRVFKSGLLMFIINIIMVFILLFITFFIEKYCVAYFV